ncbi:hypothetical protein HU200_056003 [Digitaria exilis]|uniref:Interferon-related developmental regulator N-terminal domain-containing protein n=1 Tax=Digitaria exilis TaxID=1010633 RepID=A0A835ARQ8_9POAL|nr:hypothetical protein HU200_056003 [Digitaria exilis]
MALLDMCIRALQDSRHVAREKALTVLAGALERELPPLDDLVTDTRCFSIFALCGICVKEGVCVTEGPPKEQRLAFRAVGLLALSLGGSSSEILAHTFQPLAKTISREQDDAAAVTVVAAAIDCLAAVTFAGARGRDEVERSLKVIWDLISAPAGIGGMDARKTSPQVLITAVSTWAFLLTTISETDGFCRKKPDNTFSNATVASLARLLDHDDRPVRMAAGEALAMCVELNLTQHATRKDMDALAAKVSELASELPSRGSNNTLLPEQRDLFGQIAAFLDHGERPEKLLPTSMEGCVALRVSSWAKLVQLNFLTRFLGNGFVKHVQCNELFKEAFSYGADEGKVLSISKKKQGKNTNTHAEKDSKVRRRRWDWTILCNTILSYTTRQRPEKLLQIGWQALH